MGMTLQGFVYDNSGNAIAGATVQGYESADNATAVAEASTTTDSNGKWAITTTDASHIPMDVKITYGTNHRWLKAGDKVNVEEMTVTGKLTVGEDDTGFDVQLHGATTGRSALWDESEDALQLNDNTELKFGSLAAGDMVLYHDGTNSYIKNATGALKLATESSGIAVTIGHTTSEVTIGQNLTVTGTLTLGSGAELSEAELEMLDGITAGTVAASKAVVVDANLDIASFRNLTATGALTGASLDIEGGADVNGATDLDDTDIDGTLVVDGSNISLDSTSTLNIDNSNTSNGISIGTATSGVPITIGHGTSLVTIGDNLTVTGDLTVSGDTITVNTATLTVEDPLIALATGNAGADTFDIGFYGLYDTSGSQDLYAGLFRDANDSGKWKLFKDNQAAPSATAVNTSGTGYAVGTLVATLEGNVTGALTGNADTATALATGRTIAMTGDVTWTSASFTGAGNVTGAGTIADNAVTLAKMAGIARGKIIYGDASGNPAVLASGTANQVLTMTDGDDFDWADSTVGDITNVIAGAGMTGGATSGEATLNVIGGDGIDVAADAVAVDLVANGGLEFASGELQVASGIAQHDIAQYAASVADNDFLRIDGTKVEGRSATEVLSDIGAGAAAGSSSIVTVGALDAGSITDGFGTITAGGIIKTESTTNATSTTDGSLQTDGGLSVVLDAVFGDDVTLITDAAVLNLGVGSDVKLTHDGTTGGTLSGTPVTVDSLGASALADNNYTGLVLGFIAHEDMDVGQAVYIHTDDGEVGIADANALATMPAIGVVVGADASADAAVKILVQGIYNDSDGFGGSNLTEGATMYLGEAVGTVTATIPDADGDFVQVMGVACGPRDVYINPSLDIIERAG